VDDAHRLDGASAEGVVMRVSTRDRDTAVRRPLRLPRAARRRNGCPAGSEALLGRAVAWLREADAFAIGGRFPHLLRIGIGVIGGGILPALLGGVAILAVRPRRGSAHPNDARLERSATQ
jgi:hypothetical protein